MTETINRLGIRVEQIASQANELARNSNDRRKNQDESEGSAKKGTPGTRLNANQNYQSQSTGLYMPKIIKIDFPCYEGK